MNGKVMEAKDIDGVLWLRASDVSEEIARVRSDTKAMRDYFAAKAMQGFIAAGEADAILNETNDDWPEAIAGDAYAMADAMLKARES